MKLVPSETSLVVAGAWNPAIVTPEWILKFGLKKESIAVGRVQALVPTGAGMFFDFPKFSFEGLNFLIRPDALVLNPADCSKQHMEEVEFIAVNTVTELTHTPIGGVGHNFEFRDPDPDPGFLDAFTNSQKDLVEAAPDGWGVNGSTVTTSLRKGDTLLNITRAFVGNQLSVKFNFHHQVSNGDQALEVLNGKNGCHRIFENYELARDLVKKMYGDIDED